MIQQSPSGKQSPAEVSTNSAAHNSQEVEAGQRSRAGEWSVKHMYTVKYPALGN